MTRKQKKAKTKANRAFCEANRKYNKEHPEQITDRREKQNEQTMIRITCRNVVKQNKKRREKKRVGARKKGKSPNMIEVDLWGLIVPLYVTPSNLKMVHGGIKG